MLIILFCNYVGPFIYVDVNGQHLRFCSKYLALRGGPKIRDKCDVRKGPMPLPTIFKPNGNTIRTWQIIDFRSLRGAYYYVPHPGVDSVVKQRMFVWSSCVKRFLKVKFKTLNVRFVFCCHPRMINQWLRFYMGQDCLVVLRDVSYYMLRTLIFLQTRGTLLTFNCLDSLVLFLTVSVSAVSPFYKYY